MPHTDATITIVGMGALGSRMAERLAEDVSLRCIDRDVLEQENLETSPLYTGEQAERGLPKAVAAQETLDIEAHVADLHGGNADTLLAGTDILLDGSDTVATRRILNAWAVKHDTPWVHMAALGGRGVVMPVIPTETACYACIFDHVNGTILDGCATAGLDPAIADRVVDQAVDAAHAILDGDPPSGLTHIAPDGGTRQSEVVRRSDCPVCAERQFNALQQDGVRMTRVCGDGTYHIHPNHETRIELEELVEKTENNEKVEYNKHLLRIGGGGERMTVFRDGRAIVEAESRKAARRRYARVVGR